MIRLRQVKVPINEIDKLKDIVAHKLKISKSDILDINIIKESIDSRHKPDIYLVYEVDVKVTNEKVIQFNNDIFISPDETHKYNPKGNIKLDKRPIIIGSGPAGLYAAYMLASYGYNPIIIERGSKIEDRLKDVDNFIKTGVLNTSSNVQFGEGGAGTFSDGKLNTMVKDKEFRGKKVFEIFVSSGAPKEIMYKAKPHIGTDLLTKVIINMRNTIESMGGTFKYNTKLTDIVIKNNHIEEVVIDNEHIKTDVLILAIGHSARDTFYMLNNYLNMEAKPFALGVRISHPQKMINKSQYGVDDSILGPASYKLTHTCKNGRGVYTFCMCPGGYVINSSSEEGMLSINGMSNHSRDSENANSALIVTVGPEDFGNNPMDGIEYQRTLERKAYELGNGSIPIQLYRDFKDNKKSTNLGSVLPLFKGSYTLSNINDILPDYITESVKEGIEAFGNKINGFNRDDAILAAIESRTSSPVRIIRNENYESNIEGIYPCGEGAGYAGGITSAAIDGIKVAEAIMNKYKI
ncbi:MAG: FAD-dependent oxidoreductase [Bacilli bacterium]|nr:FAD-dependent oxidoreductase [Bacilli bacterium]